jgi:hypothetical protein
MPMDNDEKKNDASNVVDPDEVEKQADLVQIADWRVRFTPVA